MARRIAVQFVAEMAAFRRGTRDGAADVRKLRDEAKAAQVEVGKLGDVGGKAGEKLADGIVRGADGRLRDARGKFVKAGQQSGEGFGEGFEKGAKGSLLKVAGMLGGGAFKAAGHAPWMGLAAIPAVAGGAAAALQGLPPLLAAIGGGLGAIPSLAAGAAGGIGTVKLATAGMGDAISEAFAPLHEDPYQQLSENGQRFVSALTAQKTALLGLRSLAQDRVFAGLDAEVTALAGELLPFATRQIDRFGYTWNQTFKQLATVGRDPVFLDGLDKAFGAADGFLDKFNARIPATGRSLGHLFSDATPFVDRFGDSLLEYVDQFNQWIDSSAQSGALEDFFEDAAVQADALLDIGREIFTIVGRIGGLSGGSTLLPDMADALARFNAEAHNMDSIEGVVRTGNEAIRGVIDVLVVLGSTLGETLADPGTAAAVALFFDVLKIGAQAVGALAQVFSLLPDPMQAVLLAGLGLAVLGNKMSGPFGKARDAVSGLTDRLQKAGPVGVKTADGLGKAERAAGRLAVAFAVGQVAGLAFGSTLNPQIDALATKLQGFARNGEVAGEASRLFGDDMGKLETALKDVADTGAWSSFARGAAGMIEGFTGLGEVMDDSLTKSKERIGALDSALTDMVANGNVQGAQDAFGRVAKSAAEQGVSVNELLKVLPGYAAAIEKAKVSGDGMAAVTARADLHQKLLSGSMQSAITTMGSYTRAWQVLHGATLSADESLLAAKDATDKVAESFRKNGDVIAGNSRKALENRVVVGQAAQAYAEAAQKKYEETGSVEQANAVYDAQVAALRGVLLQSGLTKSEVDALLGAYAKMPPVKATDVSAPGAEAAKKKVDDFNFAIKNVPPSKKVPFWAATGEATAAVNALQAKIDQLKSKKIYVTGSVRWTSSGDFKVPGGTLLKDRWGGVHEGGYAKAATGLIREAAMFGPRSPGRYMIAEPETGGEAFIPKRGNRQRSISIGQRAMEWYGMAVVPQSALTAPVASTVTAVSGGTVIVNVNAGWVASAMDVENQLTRVINGLRAQGRV